MILEFEHCVQLSSMVSGKKLNKQKMMFIRDVRFDKSNRSSIFIFGELLKRLKRTVC